MSSRVKVTFAFNLGGIGGTESYISTVGTKERLAVVIQKLMRQRNQLLHESVLWAGIRISQPDLKRRSIFLPPGNFPGNETVAGLNIPASGNRTEQASPFMTPDQARACLQIRVGFDGDRSAVRYLYGVPDGLLHGTGASVRAAGVPEWQTNYNLFVAALVDDAWSVRALIRPRVDPPAVDPNIMFVRNWVSSAGPPASIGFVLPTAPPSGIMPGTFIRVLNVRRRGTDTLSYNGRYFVQSVVPNTTDGTTTYFLRGTEDGEVESIKLPGQVQKIAYDYYPITSLLPIRAGIHKRGNVLGVPRGRRVKKPSLDP